MIDRALLARVAELAADHLDSMDDRHAGPIAGFDELRTALGGPLPEEGVEPSQVVEELARGAAPGLVASPGPRYFGFVTGGALPAALAADWLASAWDQNSFSAVSSPAASVVEEIACGWLLDVLGLPADCGVGLTTGAQMANVTGLAAARHALLARAGWDVEEQGLGGAPPLRVFAGAEAHVTRVAGAAAARHRARAGRGRARRRPGRDARRRARDLDGPAIVCAQAGNVNSGAIDPLAEITAAAREHGAWVHVDGAFGLWAAASPALAAPHRGRGRRRLVGDRRAQVAQRALRLRRRRRPRPRRPRRGDEHDGGLPHRATRAARSNSDWVPEASRRGRGFAVYAALRSLGRTGVAELVERNCALARRLAERGRRPGGRGAQRRRAQPGAARRRATTCDRRGVQADGTCWAGGTRWHDRAAMRVSVSNWSTTEADIDRCADAILTRRQARG